MRRRRPASERAREQQAEYIEKILQPELVAESEVFARKQEKRTVEISAIFSIYFPENEVIAIEGENNHFLLKRAGKSLTIWLDADDERTISIDDSDYYLSREGKLIEVKTSVFDLVPQRKPGTKDYQLVRDEDGRFVIDLRLMEGNEKIAQFLKK